MRRCKEYFGLMALALLASVGCGEKEVEVRSEATQPGAELGMDFRTNRMVNLPGDVYRQAAKSPVFWQPWIKSSLKDAEASQKMIFALLVSPKCPDYDQILGDIDKDPNLVRTLNDDYQPILVDVSASREMAILAVELCSEIQSNINFPLMVWFSPEGDPLAWLPAYSDDKKTFAEIFSRNHIMIKKMWSEDPRYISKNSKLSHELRRERMDKEAASHTCSQSPAEDSLRAVRQLTSLYDYGSHSFDGIGRNFPSGALNLLATVVGTNSMPSDLTEKSLSVLNMLLEDLLVSPMFDPLDGGVFSSKRSAGWELPFFNRDCATQAQAVSALLNVYEVTGDNRVLEKARSILAFIEKNYRTQEGLYSLGAARNIDAGDWLWDVNEIKGILDSEEEKLWVSASGMKDMGNISIDADPQRNFFRKNTISIRKTNSELADEMKMDATVVVQKMLSARKKMLKARDEKVGPTIDVTDASCEASLNIIQAYAALYRATGDEEFREKAVDLFKRANEHFRRGPELRLYSGDYKGSLFAGRAYLYALALQTVLDIAGITLNEEYLMKADDLATTTAELFAKEEYLSECPPKANLLNMPITDKLLLLNESTKELLSIAESRMAALGRPMLKSFAELASGLPNESMVFPNQYIGIIRGSIIREYRPVIVYGEDISDEMKYAISRSPLTAVRRDMVRSLLEDGIEIAADEVLLINARKNAKKLSKAADISYPALRKP